MSARQRFLSTPSARRATPQWSLNRLFIFISIHALREEGDAVHRSDHGQQPISIHALREEGDRGDPSPHRQGAISIHALREEGDTSTLWSSSCSRYFYPRPPRGGRLRVLQAQDQAVRISIHALREEGDPTKNCSKLSPRDFYPRPPRGGRQSIPSPTG